MFKECIIFYSISTSLDPRTQEFVKGRSVNLALSVRGLNALQAINAEGPVSDN